MLESSVELTQLDSRIELRAPARPCRSTGGVQSASYSHVVELVLLLYR
jgi:hypothetical protein